MSKSQKGFSPILIVVLVAVAAAGFFFFKSGGLPGGVKTLQVATEEDFANIEDPVLRKHFTAQANAAAVRTRTKSSGKGEIIDVMEYEISRNDFKMRQVQEKDGKEVAHLISIEDTTYVKDFADNTWWKQTSEPEEIEDSEIPETQEEVKEGFLAEDPSSYKSLGQEACGDLTCYKYEQTIEGGFGAKRTFWFDTKMHLLRKEVITYGEFSTEVEYSYDNINIKAPSPTKEVPEGRNVYEYYYPVEETNSGGTNEVPVPDYGDYNPEDYSLPSGFYSEE